VIVIEERDPEEVTHAGAHRVAPRGVDAFNPAFDVTPARLVSAIVTESGVVTAPFGAGLKAAVHQSTSARGAAAAV